jgi:glycosyltransferase involved in cell wall biosynthesis
MPPVSNTNNGPSPESSTPGTRPSAGLAYFVNQYPMVSQTFIRRELAELERRGWSIARYAIRPWDGAVVDPADARERDHTRYILAGGAGAKAVRLLAAVLLTLLTSPGAFARGVRTIWSLWRAGDRGPAMFAAYFAEACVLRRWCRRDGVRHLHVHFATNAATVAHTVSRMERGAVSFSVMVHGPEDLDRAPGLSYTARARDAAFIATITHFAQSQLWRWIPVELWDRVKIVRCGVDETFLADPPSVVPDSPELVCVGRLSSQKGQLVLLRAFARVLAGRPDARLVLAGDGEMRPEIEREITRLRLSAGAVEITGWLTSRQVRERLERGRALVMGSFAEGLPVVIMESLALGRPVVSTNIAGVAELVEDGGSGWLAAAADEEGLARAMLMCLSTPVDRLTQMGAHGRLAVEERHAIESVADALEPLLRSAMRA